MARPQLHSTDGMLDAARDLMLAEGARAATVEAIASASGAPTGSIYHRFGSRQALVARLWIRAVRRSQGAFVAATEAPDPAAAAVGAALSVFDFCREHPADARLLAAFGREDFVGANPSGPLAEELAELNRPVERAVRELARRLYATEDRGAVERVTLAVFDLANGAVRRPLLSGRTPSAGLRGDLEAAVRAVIARPL